MKGRRACASSRIARGSGRDVPAVMVGERLHEARAGIKDEPDQSDRGLWYKKPHVPNSQEGPDMNRAVRVIAIAPLVAMAMTRTARFMSGPSWEFGTCGFLYHSPRSD